MQQARKFAEILYKLMKLSDKDKVAIFNSLGADWSKLISGHYVKKALRLYGITDLAARLNSYPSKIKEYLDRGQIENGAVVLSKVQLWTEQQVRDIEIFWNNAGEYRPGKRSTITAKQQTEMRQLWEQGWRQADLGHKYGISQSCVSRWIHGMRIGSLPDCTATNSR